MGPLTQQIWVKIQPLVRPKESKNRFQNEESNRLQNFGIGPFLVSPISDLPGLARSAINFWLTVEKGHILNPAWKRYSQYRTLVEDPHRQKEKTWDSEKEGWITNWKGKNNNIAHF